MLRTREQYHQDLFSMRNNVFVGGNLVGRDDPQLTTGQNVVDMTYDLATVPEWKGLLTTKSSVTGHDVSRFSHLSQHPYDLLQWQKLVRTLCRRCGGCIQRCGGHDALSALGIYVSEIDKKRNSPYLRRFTDYLTSLQFRDLNACCAHIDAKGDRLRKLSEQEDPDQYLHIVEKRDEGIIVSGRKTSSMQAAYADEIIVMPGYPLDEDDRDYAIAFAIPADWEGISLITKPAGNNGIDGFDNSPFCKFGTSQSIVVFDKTYIPSERVFMCGEWDFSNRLVSLYKVFHLFNHSGCKLALSEILCGTASLAAEVNNIEHIPHIQHKILSSVHAARLAHAAGVAAALYGEKTEHGFFIPNTDYVTAAKTFTEKLINNEFGILNHISGNMTASLPLTQDFYGKETKELLRKFITRNPAIPPELSLKIWKYIESVGNISCICAFETDDMHGNTLQFQERRAENNQGHYDDIKTLARYLAGVDDTLDDERIRNEDPTFGVSLIEQSASPDG